MMPLDPFFTSKAKDEFHESHQKKRAYAKAIQYKIHTVFLSKKQKEKAMRNQLMSPAQKCKMHLADSIFHQVTQGPSLNGFDKPTRKWTKIRTSRNPK